MSCEQNPASYPPELWTTSLPGGVRILKGEAQSEEAAKRLIWHRGEAAPPMGDKNAKRGGVLRVSNVGPYPANFLAFGSPTPEFFHYNLFDCVNIPLVRQHPVNGEIIPGLAEAWAIEGPRIHFRLHRQARYSNGRPLRAADFALGTILRAQAGKDGSMQQLAALVKTLEIRGDYELSVTLHKSYPLAPLLVAAVLHPAEPGFYAEFAQDYATRYASRIPPTTGAYTMTQHVRGRLIKLERVDNWWGDSVPAFQHTHNVDAIEHHFLTDEAQAWELLRRGRLNLLQTRHLAGWMQKRDAWADERRCCFSRFRLHHPLPPYGIAINARTIPNTTIRRGLAHALDMDLAIARVFCGEYERLRSFTSGYPWQQPNLSSPPIFSPELARKYFADAGYTACDEDGILKREDGTRLSFSLLYPPSGRNATLMQVLAQQARTCGLELRTEGVAWQYCVRLLQEQRHQLLFWATVAHPLMPDYDRYFDAESQGHDAPFGLKNDTMQTLLTRYANCTTEYDLDKLSREIDALVAQECIWIPGWQENCAFTAHAPFIKFPAETRLLRTCDVADAHVLWIEE